MTALAVLPIGSLALLLLAGGGCASVYNVPVETRMRSVLDVSEFDRVLVVGFLSSGTDDIDVSLETVRLLRSQLRSREAALSVITADVLPLEEIALQNIQVGPTHPASVHDGGLTVHRKDTDLETLGYIFADAAFWQKLGEEYQGPLIVTGSLRFTKVVSSGLMLREQERFDDIGRRRVVQTREWQHREGFVLEPTFRFIDGRTGSVLGTKTFREEILYGGERDVPALSCYFELMDRILPQVLHIFADHTMRGSRLLIR